MSPAESVLIADLAATAQAVSATSKRNEKVDALATLLRRVPDPMMLLVVSYLIGEPRQGKVGLGWSSLDDLTGDGSGGVTAVERLDELIDRVAETTGPGSQGERRSLIAAFAADLDSMEADFVRRVLLGDMGQGALAGVVTTAVAKAAGVTVASVRRAAMLLGNLPEAAEVAVTSGSEGLEAIRLEVGRAVQPMLASTATDVADALGRIDGPASVEWKLDGARIQVHRDGDEVQIYTRNLNDVTSRLPEVVALVRSFPATSFVLDGEVLALGQSGNDDSPEAFQDTMSRFGSDAATTDRQLDAFFFDVLVADGVDVLGAPLSERAARLDSIVGDRRIPSVVTTDVSIAETHLREALESGHEGVMVKGVDTTYEAGRRGTGWLKVKPVHTLDLVVLAAEWGHGRRTGSLSNLHLGARDPNTGDFVMVGKTFKGLTDELLAWQTEALLARETHREGITVFVRPELVVEIAVDGAQTSRRYAGGVALRFARVRAYRHDRTADTADSIDSVRGLLH